MKRFIIAALGAWVFMSSGAQAQIAEWRDRIDPERLEAGEIHLGLFIDGEADGFMRLGWHVEDDTIALYDRSMWAANELYETQELNIALDDLAPRAVHIRFHQHNMYYLVDTEFDQGRAHGSAFIHRPGEPVTERAIDTAVPAGTVARATLFMMATVAPLELGESIAFNWYAPMSRTVEAVVLTAAEAVTVETPAGTFDTLRLEQRGGTPANDIFVDTESGRIVRIDIEGMPMQFLALPQTE